jgi:hypothetical protein
MLSSYWGRLLPGVGHGLASLLCVALAWTGPASAQFLPAPPALLNSSGASDALADEDAQPDISTDGSGNWIAVWSSTLDLEGVAGTDADILVARSTDNGTTWTPPALLNSTGTTDGATDQDELPVIQSDGNTTWIAAWNSTHDLGGTAGTDSDIFYARSTDAGVTWSPVALLNSTGTVDAAASDDRPHLAADGAGNWIAVWVSELDLGGTVGTDADIFVARSNTDGATWSAPTLLNDTATVDGASADQRPRIATDRAGNWVVVWDSRYDLAGAGIDADIFTARSTDNGASWSAAEVLSNTAAGDTAVADIRPQIATDQNGVWIVAWDSELDLDSLTAADTDILWSRSLNNGASWSLTDSLNTTADTDGTATDIRVRLVTDTLGRWAALWESTFDLGGLTGTDTDIFAARSENNGDIWSNPFPLNLSAASDGAAEDLRVAVAADAAGAWVAAWESDFDLGGLIGTDVDLLTTAVILDLTPPTADSIEVAGFLVGGTLNFSVTFNEDVEGFDDASDLVVAHNGTANTGVSISGGPQQYTVAIEGLSGEGSFTLAVSTESDVQNLAELPLASSVTSAPISIDTIGPEATSIATVGAVPTGFDSANFTVTFSEDVLGFDDAADLVVVHTGTSSSDIQITGGPAAYTVSLLGLQGDGTFTLAVSTASGITDLTNNPIAASVTSDPVAITITEPLESCPPDTLAGQRPAFPVVNMSSLLLSDEAVPFYRYETFEGVTEPIGVVRWWGAGVAPSFNNCSRSPQQYRIDFYDTLTGPVGEPVASHTVTATRVNTGASYSAYTLYRYEAELPVPVTLAEGRFGIAGVGDEDCRFGWYSSDRGDDGHERLDAQSQFAGAIDDLSFAFRPVGAEVEGEGEEEGEGEDLYPPLEECAAEAMVGQRPLGLTHPDAGVYGSDVFVADARYERFSGASEPIGGLRWWGTTINTDNSANCSRSPDRFAIAFYEDNAFSPGNIVLEQTLTVREFDTGIDLGNRSIYRYEVELPTPINLAVGWVRIIGVEVSTCSFYWYRSDQGDDGHVRSPGFVGSKGPAVI